MHTFQSIATQAGCSKRTVQTWWEKAKADHGELGTLAGEGQPRIFTDQEVALLVAYRSVRAAFPKEKRPKTTAKKAQKVDVTVEMGNHCQALTMPEINGTTFSLEHFRADDVTALTFENPDTIADEFLAVADVLIQGMDADIKTREERLQKTRTAKGRVAAKAQELKLEKRLYQHRARDLDTAQTTETQTLQDAIAGLHNLAQPQAPQNDNAA
ncbi:MAG: hypothetical protein F6J95_020650 [Leptolyngbya sp. SIO1E4]|nr:hypothetical protein [Leptolyngbya sp. SIO1E4]